MGDRHDSMPTSMSSLYVSKSMVRDAAENVYEVTMAGERDCRSSLRWTDDRDACAALPEEPRSDIGGSLRCPPSSARLNSMGAVT